MESYKPMDDNLEQQKIDLEQQKIELEKLKIQKQIDLINNENKIKKNIPYKNLKKVNSLLIQSIIFASLQVLGIILIIVGMVLLSQSSIYYGVIGLVMVIISSIASLVYSIIILSLDLGFNNELDDKKIIFGLLSLFLLGYIMIITFFCIAKSKLNAYIKLEEAKKQ